MPEEDCFQHMAAVFVFNPGKSVLEVTAIEVLVDVLAKVGGKICFVGRFNYNKFNNN